MQTVWEKQVKCDNINWGYANTTAGVGHKTGANKVTRAHT